MTGVFNNAAFRNQAWAAQQDAITDSMMQRAAMNVAGSVQRAGEFAEESARQQVITDAKLQLMEQEMQQNAFKLRAMEQIDYAKRSHEQTRAMQLENRARELDIRKREEALRTADEDRAQSMFADVMSAFGGPEGAAAYGFNVTGGDGQPFHLEYDPEKAQDALDRMQDRGFRSSQEKRLQEEALRRKLEQLNKSYYSLDGRANYYKLPEEERARLDAAKRDLEERLWQLGGSHGRDGGPQTVLDMEPGLPQQPAPMPAGRPEPRDLDNPEWPTPQEPISEERARELGAVAAMTQQAFDRDESWSGFLDGLSDDDRTFTLGVIASYAQDLVASNRTTPEMAPGYVMDVLRGKSMQTANLLYVLGYDPEKQIIPILKSRGASPKLVQRARRYIEELHRRAKEIDDREVDELEKEVRSMQEAARGGRKK